MEANKRLQWAKFISKLTPATRSVAEAHSGLTCHRDALGGHYWIQRYNDDGSVWLLRGRDGVLPGLETPRAAAGQLRECGCGQWMPASAAQARATAAALARVLGAAPPGGRPPAAPTQT